MLKAGSTLVPNFQHRVLLGISTFMGILLLVGWIVINEPARMDVFTSQYHGRSIENGATIFLSTCSPCHGVDGKGNIGKAPALNNPMLFLKDNPAKLASAQIDSLKQQLTDTQTQITTYNKNVQDFEQANADLLKNPNDKTLQTKITSLTSQITTFDLAKTQQQADNLTSQINSAIGNLTLLKAQGWDPNRDVRLKEVKWTGTLQGYLESTISSGRPVSALYWPAGPMPAWGQAAGGPLRPDEIQDVAQYIMNFEDGAVKMSPKDVNQQFKNPVDAAVAGGPAVSAPSAGAVGLDADTKKLAANDALKGGDPDAGRTKYNTLGCAGCHLQGTTGPITSGTFTRILNTRMKDNAGKWASPEEYIAESIIHPNAYIVPSYQPNIMIQTFGNQLSVQDIKDLIAFLETQK